MSDEVKSEQPSEEKLSKEQLFLRMQALEKMQEILASREKIDDAIKSHGVAVRENYQGSEEDRMAGRDKYTLSELDELRPAIFNSQGALLEKPWVDKISFKRIELIKENNGRSNRENILFESVEYQVMRSVLQDKGGMFYEEQQRIEEDPTSEEGMRFFRQLNSYRDNLRRFLEEGIQPHLKLKLPVNTSYELSKKSCEKLQEEIDKYAVQLYPEYPKLHVVMNRILDDPIYHNPTDLIKRIKPKKLHHGEWADPVMKGLFIGGSVTMLLQTLQEVLKLSMPYLGIVAPWVYFAWNAVDALASLCAEQSEDKRIAKAKTHIGKKEMFQGVSRLGSGILFTTNLMTGSTSSVFGIGMSPLLTAAFLPLAGFGFALTMWISAARAYSGYVTAKKKCDPDYLLRDRLKKAKVLKAEIKRLEGIVNSAGFSTEERAQARKKLHKYNRDLMRLELQHIALAKQVIQEIGEDSISIADDDDEVTIAAKIEAEKIRKANELAAQFAKDGYKNISADSLLKEPTDAERELAKRLLDKQRAKADERLVDVVAWVCAALGMTLAAFALVFPPSALILGIVAMIFLALACGIKGYQLYQKRAVARIPKQELPDSKENIARMSNEDQEIEAAWQLCQAEIIEEQVARLYAAITPEDIALAEYEFPDAAGNDSLLKTELVKKFIPQFEQAIKAQRQNFCQGLSSMQPAEKDRYLQNARDRYDEREVVRQVNAQIIRQDIHQPGFVYGLSRGDRGYVARDQIRADAKFRAETEAKIRAQAREDREEAAEDHEETTIFSTWWAGFWRGKPEVNTKAEAFRQLTPREQKGIATNIAPGALYIPYDGYVRIVKSPGGLDLSASSRRNSKSLDGDPDLDSSDDDSEDDDSDYGEVPRKDS